MAQPATSEEIVAKAEELHLKGNFQEVFDLLSDAEKHYPKDVEILYRLARAHFDFSEKESNKNNKKEHLEKGLELAKRALEADDKHWASHKWLAILLSSLGDYVSTKEKIGNAYKIKELALKANELKPNDPTTIHMLGRWCFGVANISWMERTAASALFATPPTSSFEEALKYFLEAAELQPNFIRNAVFIGDCYTNLKQTDKAKEWYKKASEMDAPTEVAKVYLEEAKKKLN